jgi:hypothetical protein
MLSICKKTKPFSSTTTAASRKKGTKRKNDGTFLSLPERPVEKP